MLCLLLTWTPRYRHSTLNWTRVFSSGTQGQDPLCLLCWRCCHNFSDKQPRITFTTCKDDDEIARTSFFRLGIDQRCWGESSLSLLQLHFCSGIMHRPLLLSFTQNTRNSVLPTKYYRNKTSTHSRNKLKIFLMQNLIQLIDLPYLRLLPSLRIQLIILPYRPLLPQLVPVKLKMMSFGSFQTSTMKQWMKLMMPCIISIIILMIVLTPLN